MLILVVPERRMFNDEHERFITFPEIKLHLEHSLWSISKWESKYCKPYLSSNDKTKYEILDYIRQMILPPTDANEISDLFLLTLPQESIVQISEYINAPMTATTFSKHIAGSRNKEIITSELIYYWMIANQIPFECERWHLNRLLTLVTVCSIKNAPPKKMSKRDILSRNARLNAERKNKLNTNG